MSGGELQIRDIREAPWCWQQKSALRLIRRSFKPSEIAPTMMAYVVLTELASDRESSDFKTKRQTIGDMLGRSVDSVDIYLNRLEELKLIEKTPVVENGEYKRLAIKLLPCPVVAESARLLSEPTPPAESREHNRPPGVSQSATPPTAIGLSSEESSSKKNPLEEHPGATSAPDSAASTPSEEPTSADPGGPAPATVGTRPAHPGCSGPVASRRAGSGVTVPGTSKDWSEGTPRPPKKERVPKNKDLHAILPAEKWGARDVLGYFADRFRAKWPMEAPPDFSWSKDIPAINGRLAWLKKENMTPEVAKKVIDHLFAGWDNGLPSRLGWKGERPGLALIESVKWFDTLLREVQNGAPKARQDVYDPEEAKKYPDTGWK